MLKRISIYFLMGFVFAALIWGFFYSGANGDVVEFFLSPYFQKNYGAKVQLKNFEGGILKGIEIDQVKLNWPKLPIFNFLQAEKVFTGFKIVDLFRSHDADQFISLDSIYLGLQRFISIGLPRPFQFLGRENHINGNALRQGTEVIKISHGRIIIDNLRETLFYFNQVFLKFSLDKNIVKEFQILASSPELGHQNLFAFHLQGKRTKIVISDYSMAVFKELTPYFQILGGVLNSEIIFEQDRLDHLKLHLKDLKIRLDSGEEDIVQLEIVYQNENLDIKTLTIKRPGIDFELTGMIRHSLGNPVVDFKSVFKEGEKTFWNEVSGSLERPEFKGEFRDLSSEASFKSLNWKFRTGGITLVQRGLLIRGIDGNLLFEKLSPLKIKGDLILSGNSVVFRRVVFEDRVRMDGVLNFFPELFIDAQVKLEKSAFKGKNIFKNTAFNPTRFKGHLCGNLSQWSFISKGFLNTDRGGIDFRFTLKRDYWSLKIKREAIHSKELDIPSFDINLRWDHQKMKMSLKMPESGNRVLCVMDLSMNHIQDILRWIRHSKDCVREREWNLRIELPNWKMGSFKLGGALTFDGTYRISPEQISLDGILGLKGFNANGTLFPEGKGSLHYDTQSGILKLEELKIGDGYILKGEYDFLKNHLIFIFNLDNVAISDLKIFSPKGKAPFLDGKMKGQIRLEGSPDYPAWQGRLEMDNGQFLELKFDEAFFNLSGYGTIVDLRDSKIIAKNGQWKIVGNINLGERRPFRDVRFAMDPQKMNLKGIEIRNDEEMKETTFEKQIGKGLAFSLKARQASEEVNRPNQDSDAEVQLQYEYYPNQDVLFRMDENEQMFGVRKKVEF